MALKIQPMSETQPRQTEKEKTMAERITEYALEAKLKNRQLVIVDARYSTAGIPSEITKEYVFFNKCTEVISIDGTGGKVSGISLPMGRLIAMSCIVSIDTAEL